MKKDLHELFFAVIKNLVLINHWFYPVEKPCEERPPGYIVVMWGLLKNHSKDPY